MTSNRISYIDLGAGVMILWMILGHAIMAAGYTGDPIRSMGITNYVPNFLFFFMPWFFYKSGQFFKRRSLMDEWNRDGEKLMKQFFFWSALGYVLYLISLGLSYSLTFRNVVYIVIRRFVFGGSIELNHPLWFLFTLFVIKQVANILLPNEDDEYYWLKCITVIFISYTIGFGLYCLKCRFIPIWIANGSTGLTYFTLGYCMSKHETKWWLFVPCIMVFIASWFLNFPSIDLHLNRCGSASIYLMSLPSAFAGIVSFNLLCRLVSIYLNYLSLPFEYVGKYAMIIYVSHGLLYGSIPWIIDSLDYRISHTCALWIILGSYIIFLPLFCYLSKKIPPNK